MKIPIILMGIISLSCFSADPTYECIGLGSNCTVAAALQTFDLKNASYPFDWIVSPYESLCNVLENDFQDFINSSVVSVRPNNREIMNTYGFIFPHDFPIIFYPRDLDEEGDPASKDVVHPDWMNSLPEVQKKYDRRIQRFRDVCMSEKKIYFIRYGEIRSPEETCSLRDILKKTYPNLDFTLVVVGNSELFAEPWQKDDIKNYYLKPAAAWNDVVQWKTIFMDLGLISPLKQINLEEKMNYYTKKMFYLQ